MQYNVLCSIYTTQYIIFIAYRQLDKMVRKPPAIERIAIRFSFFLSYIFCI